MKLRILTLIMLVFVLFVWTFAVFAQDDPGVVDSPALPEWALGLPAVLSGLVLFNYRVTDTFKRMLASNKFGGVPAKDVQAVLVVLFSMVLGVLEVLVTPDALSYLPTAFQYPVLGYPVFGYIIAGVSVSTLGGFVYQVLGRINAPTQTTSNVKIEASTQSTPVVSEAQG